MQISNKRKEQTEKLTLMALLTALVAVLSYFGGFIKIGSLASINLTLIPVVLGAVLYGPIAGGWLGAVAGVIFFITPDAAVWLALNPVGTVITVMLKSSLAGACAGLAYGMMGKFNKYLAVIVSAMVAPIVNTCVFLLGCSVFFLDSIKYEASQKGISILTVMIVTYVGLNFVFEFIANVVVSPTLFKLVNIRKKKQ